MKSPFGLCAFAVLAALAVLAACSSPSNSGPGYSFDNPLVITLPTTFVVTSWDGIAAEIIARGGGSVWYIALDLSACSGMAAFNPDPTKSDQKEKIVSLVLPNNVMTIVPGGANFYEVTFHGFLYLRAVSGANVVTIGDYAFHNSCPNLATADFPNVISIGDHAFSGNSSGPQGSGMTTASFPKATSIGEGAFSNCYDLTTVNLPKATSIGKGAFAITGTAKTLTVILGATAPVLGTSIFSGIPETTFGETGVKSVIVKVPGGATGYATTALPVTHSSTETGGGPHWGEGFRGKGWTGGAYESSGVVNENISLTIQELP